MNNLNSQLHACLPQSWFIARTTQNILLLLSPRAMNQSTPPNLMQVAQKKGNQTEITTTK
eukprot:m.44570 g.44570  ORF g.44570 m.44570 type:complete len:60 (+) comp10839_c0_seq2:3061-3240(+)